MRCCMSILGLDDLMPTDLAPVDKHNKGKERERINPVSPLSSLSNNPFLMHYKKGEI